MQMLKKTEAQTSQQRPFSSQTQLKCQLPIGVCIIPHSEPPSHNILTVIAQSKQQLFADNCEDTQDPNSAEGVSRNSLHRFCKWQKQFEKLQPQKLLQRSTRQQDNNKMYTNSILLCTKVNVT